MAASSQLFTNLPLFKVVFGCFVIMLIIMNLSCSYSFARKTAEFMYSSNDDNININQNVTIGSYHLDSVTSRWGPAVATWYGAPDGFGTDGGACGYQADVGKYPFSSLVSAGGPSLFLENGAGCGTCFQVRCSSNEACSGKPVTVVITDSCPGGPCASDATHFDLSGTAFGALAISGQENALRNAGSIHIDFQRVECSYRGTPLTFKVDVGSNPYYFAVAIEYIPGDGDLDEVALQQTSISDAWLPMRRSWGAVWAVNSESGSPFQGPFSIRITDNASETIVAENVIPADWVIGATYKARRH